MREAVFKTEGSRSIKKTKVYKTNKVFLKESEARLALRKEVKEASNLKKSSAIGDVKSA